MSGILARGGTAGPHLYLKTVHHVFGQIRIGGHEYRKRRLRVPQAKPAEQQFIGLDVHRAAGVGRGTHGQKSTGKIKKKGRRGAAAAIATETVPAMSASRGYHRLANARRMIRSSYRRKRPISERLADTIFPVRFACARLAALAGGYRLSRYFPYRFFFFFHDN